jgi:DNA replication regulator DPB11
VSSSAIRTHLSRSAGISNPPQFSPQCTHLVCPDRTGKKYEKALEWGIEVVDLDWLWDLTRNGPKEPKALTESTTPRRSPTPDNNNATSGSSVESAIIDITNSCDLRPHSQTSTFTRKRRLETTPGLENERPSMSFGSAYLLSTQSTLKDAPPPVKRSRTMMEPMRESGDAVSSSFQPHNPIKSKSFSSFEGEMNDIPPAVKQTEVVPSSVTPSPRTPTAAIDAGTSRVSGRAHSKPPHITKHITRELQHTISDLLNKVNTSEPRSDDDPEKMTRRDRPARVRVSSSSFRSFSFPTHASIKVR